MSNDIESQRRRFRLDEPTKAARAEDLRRRFQAATPATRKPPVRWVSPVDWRRAIAAAILVTILLVVWLLH